MYKIIPTTLSVSVDKNTVMVIDQNGSYNFDTSTISSKDSIQTLEDYLNNEWLPKIVGYQIKVKIFSVSPLVLVVCTPNELGEKVSGNWWKEGLIIQ